MKALVIGFGSIGKRHAANLAKLGHEVALLRHATGTNATAPYSQYYELDEALTKQKPDFAVVCSPTSNHVADATRLIERGIPLLLEKPPALDLQSAIALQNIIEREHFGKHDLAFNLRYYPPLCFIKDYLPRLGKIYAVRVAAGFYLPDWRPTVDYRQTTSAREDLGGGVHIELVHEIDYICWFLGMPASVVAHIARVSNLEITSSDLCSTMLCYADGAVVELHLDYLSRKNLRGCQIIAQEGTLEWSFTERLVQLYPPSGQAAKQLFCLDPGYNFNQTYLDQLENFVRVVEGVSSPRVDVSQGVKVMRILDGMIRSAATRQWIDLSQNSYN